MAAAAGAGHGLIVTRAATHQVASGTDWPWFGEVQYCGSTLVLRVGGRLHRAGRRL